MIYRVGITTPASTTEVDRKKTTLKLTKGVIHQIDIQFPPGPAGDLHVTIERALTKIWPSNEDESFASDAQNISFREDYDVAKAPLQLEIYTWNDDTVNDHLVIVRIGLLPRKSLIERLF